MEYARNAPPLDVHPGQQYAGRYARLPAPPPEKGHNEVNPTTALLVIDVQRGLFEKSTPIFQADRLLANINTLIHQAHRSGAPVIIVQHANDSFLARESEGWQVHAQVQTGEGDLVIHKTKGNAFEKTLLRQELEARGITTLVATGLVSHGCVKATCLGARDLGYRVILASDAHSNFHKNAASVIQETHHALSEAGVELIPTAEIVF